MAQGRPQFIGAAGQYFVAYGLAVRQINAALTLGNAPSVDVLASSSDGTRTLALQVKTASFAYRRSRYGVEGYEWNVNAGVIGRHDEQFWYAFVDLQEEPSTWNPRVFFVPSRWVSEFVKADWSRYRYFLPHAVADLTLNRWDLVQDYLGDVQSAVAWAKDWPESRLVKWGTTS